MQETAMQDEYDDFPDPDISHIITEDDTPVDNIFSEKQQRLLAESLNNSWNTGRPFVAAANVGVFNKVSDPAIVPDMFLSLDVELPEDIWKKRNRSYFIWEYGKPPELVVEVVSNKQGGENSTKIQKYADMCVWYYIIYDPQHFIQKEALRVYELSAKGYIPKIDNQLSQVGLKVTLWEGIYEGRMDTWLRFCDEQGNLIPTGHERADAERNRAELAQQETEAERNRAELAQQEAEAERENAKQAKERERKLAAKLRAMGIDPDDL
ncbi:Uma2 family endonuclease [Desulfobacterales bacterium HSG17]|nr:Uma2 family endonuclease [Desulfobacterales bacterium HSG17]